MTEATPSETFPLTKAVFEGLVTYAIDARVLHTYLQIAKDFPDWVLGWVDSGKFHEQHDFLRREQSHLGATARNSLDFLMSIDMAKEIAFAEESPSRNLVRRLLINAQKSTVFGLVSETRLTFDRPIDQLVEIAAYRVIERMLPALLSKAIADRRIQIRIGSTSGQIWDEYKFPKVGLSTWLGNRLQAAGCQIEGYGQLGDSKARLFDQDKAARWLAAGGRQIVERKIQEKLGQGHFNFTFSPRRAP